MRETMGVLGLDSFILGLVNSPCLIAKTHRVKMRNNLSSIDIGYDGKLSIRSISDVVLNRIEFSFP